jgi:exonuclease SbcD
MRVPARDGTESATFVALPWVPERYALRFEDLAAGIDDARTRYRHIMESLIERCFGLFASDTINVFLGHLLIDGVTIGEGSGERKIHIDKAFAVNAACIDDTANYVALGHVHKRQQIAAASPTYYSGSLVQLDFGEGGRDGLAGQTKYVNIVDARPRISASVDKIEITGGRGLHTVTLPIDDLPSHAGKYGDDYLRVLVQADRPVASLVEQVRDVLPNALDVSLERTDEPQALSIAGAPRHGLAPHELLGRYYQVKHSAEIPEPLVGLFNELYEAEAGHAPA